jgi:sugar lactone lactonase YvrE
VLTLEATPALLAHAELAEGPVWDADRGLLWWVDITPGVVHAFDPVGGFDRAYPFWCSVGAVALRHDGTLLVAAEHGFAVLDPANGSVATILAWPAEAPARRANDGKCDPEGRFLVDRMGLDAAVGQGGLYRLDADLTLTSLVDGLTVPNGLAWRSDGGEMYFIDSPSRAVTAYGYDLSTGDLGAARPLAALMGDGVPDGMTIDADDCLWVAIWGGSRVVRLTPQGDILMTITLPVSRPTSCTFGGPELDELYITTARQGLSHSELKREPLAGSLFRARPGVTGVLPVPFAG